MEEGDEEKKERSPLEGPEIFAQAEWRRTYKNHGGSLGGKVFIGREFCGSNSANSPPLVCGYFKPLDLRL